MKIALIGDVHGGRSASVSAIYAAKEEGAERIIFLGDFGYDFSSTFVGELADASRDTGLIIDWIDGNHEDFDFLESVGFDLSDRFKYHKRGSVEEIDGVRFMFLGGASSVDRQARTPHVSWWPQESLTDTDIAQACKNGTVDVILSHDAPHLPPMMDDATAPFPRIDLLISQLHRVKYGVIYNNAHPSYVFHGHYHVLYEHTYDEWWGPVKVTGLNCSGYTMAGYVRIIDTEDLK